MKTTTPSAQPSEIRLRITALIESTTDRNARISSTNVSRITKPRTYGKLP
jgi:lipopolysaccharide biosynthesis protein